MKVFSRHVDTIAITPLHIKQNDHGPNPTYQTYNNSNNNNNNNFNNDNNNNNNNNNKTK